MKKLLITGINSYIGNAVADYLSAYNQKQGRELYCTEKLSLRDGSWQQTSFSGYDAILHVAGKAHADVGNVSEETKAEYYRINTELTAQVAEKAKKEGVGQFIYMSSVIVYGDSAEVGKQKIITAGTLPCPASFYGDSKLQAEKKLELLKNGSFHVAVLRPPLIYGKGSRGNYPALERLASRLPVFPSIENQRSMLYIENLAEFVRQLLERGEGGLFFPQNSEYVATAQLVKLIAAAKGKKVRLWRCLNPLVRLASRLPSQNGGHSGGEGGFGSRMTGLCGKVRGLCNKAFGSLTLDTALSRPEGYSYQIYSLEESVQRIYEN